MPNIKTLLLAATTATATLTAGTPAVATDWHILMGSTVKCERAAALSLDFSSPLSLEMLFRSKGEFSDTEVTREYVNEIFEVTVTNMNGQRFLFFPSKDKCERFRDYNLTRGIITDPAELK